MELRKDPLTRSWVLTGDDIPETAPRAAAECRLCPGSRDRLQQISSRAAIHGGPWSARAVVHPNAIYHIEGPPDRRGEGLYDRMPTLGAHEVLVENPKHDRQLWQADDASLHVCPEWKVETTILNGKTSLAVRRWPVLGS